jgi:PAS domain S-box-containing protein
MMTTGRHEARHQRASASGGSVLERCGAGAARRSCRKRSLNLDRGVAVEPDNVETLNQPRFAPSRSLSAPTGRRKSAGLLLIGEASSGSDHIRRADRTPASHSRGRPSFHLIRSESIVRVAFHSVASVNASQRGGSITKENLARPGASATKFSALSARIVRLRLPTALRQGLALVLVPAVVLVGLEIYQIVRTVPELRRSQDLVARTIEVITTAQSLQLALRDAERGQRGFLITGDAAYLDPYRSGLERIPAILSKLKQLTADNPEQQRRWPNLESEIDIKLAELKRTVDARQNDGFDAARKIVETNVGADSMRAIAQLIDAAITAEKNLLKDRQALGDTAERTTAIVSLIGGAVAFSLMILGAILVFASFRRISSSEAALSESEQRFRLMVSGIEDYAIFMVDPEGRVINWNRGAERMKGYRSEEIVGRHFSCFYRSEDIESGVPARLLETAIANGSALAEGWRVRKDGSQFWASVLITAIRDDRGELLGFAKLTRDLTDRVEAEVTLAQEREERKRAEEILRQSQKMEALGQLTGGIAHDFNNMLGVIIGNLEILQRRLTSDDPRVGERIESALQGADRAAALTQQLLAFSRRQPLEPRSIDVNRLVSGMSNLLHRTLGESIAIETVSAAGLWAVYADVNQLENALLNLGVNARDAMPNGGKITIETGNVHLDEAYAAAHAEVTTGQYVMVAVTDTGVGMSKETIDKAFEPFFTTKEAGHGTGLGLSQVYGFVKQSAGHMKIYSELGQGTTVKLYLPRLAGDSVDIRDVAGRQPVPAEPRAETILVVEDNELLLMPVAEVLQEQGYRVLTATDGATALDVLEKEADVRLVFTDVGLPGALNGRQLADEAQRQHPGLLVLFTTGYARNAIIHQGRLDPGVEFIAKPFTFAGLIAKIRGVLGEAG